VPWGQQAAQGPVPFVYQAPVIASLSPPNAPARGGATLTIRGANFGYVALPVVLLPYVAVLLLLLLLLL
jgi:hypothetical protein